MEPKSQGTVTTSLLYQKKTKVAGPCSDFCVVKKKNKVVGIGGDFTSFLKIKWKSLVKVATSLWREKKKNKVAIVCGDLHQFSKNFSFYIILVKSCANCTILINLPRLGDLWSHFRGIFLYIVHSRRSTRRTGNIINKPREDNTHIDGYGFFLSCCHEIWC